MNMRNSTLLNEEFIIETLSHGGVTIERLNTFGWLRAGSLRYIQPPGGIITLVLNFVVFILCFVIYSNTKKKNHKPAFLYIGFLAFFDMIIGGINSSGGRQREFADNIHIEMCTIQDPFFLIIQWSSFYMLLVLTIDRYIFIKRPLHYPLIMTPCRTWLMIIAAILVGVLVGMQAFIFSKIPPGYVDGQVCTVIHFYPGWIHIRMAVTYSVVLITQISVYSVMLVKFEQSRKKLQALKKIMDEEVLPVSNLSFQQVRGLFKKDVPSEEANPPVQILSMKHIGDAPGGRFTQENLKMK